jgi:hypothetical protein
MLQKIPIALNIALIIIALPLAVLGSALTPETFVVDPGSYRHWAFEVSRSARVFGQFRAQGGGNDIRVLLIDENEFENFRNGRDVRSYYTSGQVSAGQMDLRLRYGRYVLIFDNGFSPYSSKTIRSNLQLEED